MNQEYVKNQLENAVCFIRGIEGSVERMFISGDPSGDTAKQAKLIIDSLSTLREQLTWVCGEVSA